VTEIGLDKCYRHRDTGCEYHILTYLRTKTFGMTLLTEYYDGICVNIIPIDKENFDDHISDYEEIAEDEFAE